jgi:hypothetical protein
MKKVIAATALTAALVIGGAAFAQTGGDAGTANKNVGSAASAPDNQSGTTDSRSNGATAAAPGASTGTHMKKKSTAKNEKMMKSQNQKGQM